MKRRFNRVGVLKGGVSSEREVSLRSGAAVADGLRRCGYAVEEIDITTRDLKLPDGIQALFIALHGTFGEDGTVQRMLDETGVPYTGSGAASSMLSFDKVRTRDHLTAHGLPVPPGEVLQRARERTLSFPLVVKPPREGSSVGCHIVQSEAEWEEAFSDTVAFSGVALAETFIPGRELTVGIVEWGEPGGGGLRVLPAVEIEPAGGWYDYAAKYTTGETRYTVPARLDADVADRLRELALKTFECLGARGLGRVDFRLSPQGEPYILELNAIPGFTATSLLPKAAAAAGIPFSELCSRIMESAQCG